MVVIDRFHCIYLVDSRLGEIWHTFSHKICILWVCIISVRLCYPLFNSEITAIGCANTKYTSNSNIYYSNSLQRRRMTVMEPQITGNSIVCSIVCLWWHQIRYQSVTGPLWGNAPVTDGLPPPPPPPPPHTHTHTHTHTHRASNAETVSMSWRHLMIRKNNEKNKIFGSNSIIKRAKRAPWTHCLVNMPNVLATYLKKLVTFGSDFIYYANYIIGAIVIT